MGSKARLISQVSAAIEELEPSRVVDLFAGTGSVGYALNQSYPIVSNDLEPYAYVINEGILNGCFAPFDFEAGFFKVVDRCLQIVTNHFGQMLALERGYLKAETVGWEAYQVFCESTPAFGYVAEEDNPAFRPILDLIETIECDGNLPFDCLFATYYGNTYFGFMQCCEIDAIHTAICEYEDSRIKNVLMTALMSVMSDCASTTTHFAQYLKVRSERTCKNLISKRSVSIRALLSDKLRQYRARGIMSVAEPSAVCFNLDFSEALSRVPTGGGTVVYADPPYFKEHYSRYYHILNTLCLYDYPAVAVNPQTHTPSIGRYRANRSASDFGKRATALPAFCKLIGQCRSREFDLVVSYSSNSIVSIDDLINAMKESYKVSVKAVPLKHSNQGRANRGVEKVSEYILSGRCGDA